VEQTVHLLHLQVSQLSAAVAAGKRTGHPTTDWLAVQVVALPDSAVVSSVVLARQGRVLRAATVLIRLLIRLAVAAVARLALARMLVARTLMAVMAALVSLHLSRVLALLVLVVVAVVASPLRRLELVVLVAAVTELITMPRLEREPLIPDRAVAVVVVMGARVMVGLVVLVSSSSVSPTLTRLCSRMV
jgi:hypothetical protein